MRLYRRPLPVAHVVVRGAGARDPAGQEAVVEEQELPADEEALDVRALVDQLMSTAMVRARVGVQVLVRRGLFHCRTPIWSASSS